MIATMFAGLFGHIEPARTVESPSTLPEAQAALRRANDDLTVIRDVGAAARANSARLSDLGADITSSMRRR